MSGSTSFSWIGTGTGTWNTPGNWADVTTGQTPAVVAPGSFDAVILGNSGTAATVTVSGNGSAARITVQGTDDVLDTVNTGTLVVDQPGTLGIEAGATISADAATDLGTIAVDSGGLLLVNGTLQIGSVSLAGWLAGPAETAAAVLSDNPGNFVDASDGIVVGTVSSNIDSRLLIEPGITLSGAGSIVGSIVDNGLIVGGKLSLGQANFFSTSGGPFGYGPPIFDGYDFTTALSGAGTVEVQSGGTINLAEPITASGPTFQLDGRADLDIKASIASRQHDQPDWQREYDHGRRSILHVVLMVCHDSSDADRRRNDKRLQQHRYSDNYECYRLERPHKPCFDRLLCGRVVVFRGR